VFHRDLKQNQFEQTTLRKTTCTGTIRAKVVAMQSHTGPISGTNNVALVRLSSELLWRELGPGVCGLDSGHNKFL